MDAASPAATGVSSLPFIAQLGTSPTAASGEAGTDAWTDNFKDGDIDLPNDNSVFGVGRPVADVSALLADAGLPTDALRLSI